LFICSLITAEEIGLFLHMPKMFLKVLGTDQYLSAIYAFVMKLTSIKRLSSTPLLFTLALLWTNYSVWVFLIAVDFLHLLLFSHIFPKSE
jgi:hypothetical protein